MSKYSYLLYSLSLSTLASGASLIYSNYYGRLSQQLSYDDVTYIIDAGGRLKDGNWFLGLFTSPPHSPFQTILALSGLKLFGFHDLSPYIFGAVTFATLLVIFAFSLPVGKRHSFYISLILSFSSIGYFGFTEFRPDLSYAFVTATGLVLLVQRNWPIRGGIGVILIAFWIKPSFFLHTLALFMAAIAIRTLFSSRSPSRIKQRRSSNLVFAFGSILFASYYLFALEKTINYFIRGTVTESNVWRFPESVSNLEAYYWYSGFQRVSSTVVIGSIMGLGILYSSFSVLIYSRSDFWKLRVNNGIQLWVLAFISLSIVSLGRIPNHFFGATAALLFFASSMIFVARRKHAQLALAVFTVVSVVMASMSLNRTNLDFPSRDASVSNPASNLIFSTMRNNQIEKLFVPFQGQVNAVTLGWENMKTNRSFLFDDLSVMPTLEASMKRADEMGAILCPKETADYYTYLPSAETSKMLCSLDSISGTWKRIDLSNNYYILKKVK